MNDSLGRVFKLIDDQRGLVAAWQMRQLDVGKAQMAEIVRRLRRVHRGVYAAGDVDELGWYLAAALALGPAAAVSELSVLMLLGLRPYEARAIDVTVPRGGGRSERDGIAVHRSRDLQRTRWNGVPITTPTQALRDAPLKRHELYRALEEVDRLGLSIDRSVLRADVVELQRSVRGRTRSDTEAAFLILCHDHGLKLPLVNFRLNRYLTDFHWRQAGLVVEVDGFEHHRERPQFNEDRLRGLRHRVAGYEVVRVSADHVYDEPALVVDALLAAAPSLRLDERSRPARAIAPRKRRSVVG